MSKILLDGEGIYTAIYLTSKKHPKFKMDQDMPKYDALLNLVTAIVLWDDIYFFEDGERSNYTLTIGFFSKYEKNFHKIFVDTYLPKDLEEIALKFLDNYDKKNSIKSELPFDLVEIPEQKKLFLSEGKRALEYLLAANIKGLDYMPSVERQIILQHYNYTEFFLRKDVINKVDLELTKYYESVNSNFPVKRINYSIPILLDYLLDKYNLEDVIEGAIELKSQQPLRKFRKEMDDLDRAWEIGDIKQIDNYFTEVEQIVSGLSSLGKFHKKLNITISFPPALSFDINLPQKKRIQSVFLKDLAFYGITNRTPYIF